LPECGRAGGQPHAFLAYAGFLTGIVIGRPLELARVGFDPRSATVGAKIARYVLSVALTTATLIALDRAFSEIAGDFSPAGYALHYARYTIAGCVSIFAAPLLFTAVGLAQVSAGE
jgi:hypothetical protein